MFPTLLARTILCVAGRIVDRQLTRNIIYDARRNTLQVLQKCAQKTHSAELQSKSQAVVIATANRDELPIRIIQMEAPRQLLGRSGVVAVAGPLVLAQETDRHWIGSPKEGNSRSQQYLAKPSLFARTCAKIEREDWPS